MSATQDAKIWFVSFKGKRYGPYTFSALVHDAARGLVDRDAGVWCLGWAEWRIARNVPGLFEAGNQIDRRARTSVRARTNGPRRGRAACHRLCSRCTPDPSRGRLGCDFAGHYSRDIHVLVIPRSARWAAKLRAKSFTLDGEAAVSGADGIAVFEALYRRRAAPDTILHAFDLLELNGKDLRPLPLGEHKAKLARLPSWTPILPSPSWCAGPGARRVVHFALVK
jgi:GYF domain 2